jgi:hypothetical protein
MNTISKRLKIARLARGFTTRRQAAICAGVRPPTFLNHEDGRSGMNAKYIGLYAEKFNVSLYWLVYGTGHPLDHIKHATQEEKNIFDHYSAIEHIKRNK